MNFEDEPYVRLYTADTATWALLGWEGQTVLMHMLRGKFDRAGIFECGDDPARAIRAVTRLPEAIVTAGLAEILREGVWQIAIGRLVWPKYTHAQTCPRSDRLRQLESRRNRLAMAIAKTRGESQNVTDNHAESQVSQTVTLSRAEQSRAEIRNVEFALDAPGSSNSLEPDPKPKKAAKAAWLPDEIAVFEAWRVKLGHPQAKPNPSRLAKIRARIREGFTAAQLIQAIENSKNDPFLMGDNPNGKKYDDLESLLRDGSKVERLIALTAPSRPAPIRNGRATEANPNLDHDTRAALAASRRVQELTAGLK